LSTSIASPPYRSSLNIIVHRHDCTIELVTCVRYTLLVSLPCFTEIVSSKQLNMLHKNNDEEIKYEMVRNDVNMNNRVKMELI
jgi:hypothetical protein